MRTFVKRGERSTFIIRMDAAERAGFIALVEDMIGTMEAIKERQGKNFPKSAQALLSTALDHRHSLLHPEDVT